MEGMKKLYVQADEICEDWGVSKSQAYKMIQELKDAGIDTIIAEKQAQLDAWAAQQ